MVHIVATLKRVKGTVSQNLPLCCCILCLKGIAFRMVRQPFKFIFIKGPVSKLHLHKDVSVYRTFVIESAEFLQSIEFGVQHTLELASLHQKLA